MPRILNEKVDEERRILGLGEEKERKERRMTGSAAFRILSGRCVRNPGLDPRNSILNVHDHVQIHCIGRDFIIFVHNIR
jgi:hypothetical protein